MVRSQAPGACVSGNLLVAAASIAVMEGAKPIVIGLDAVIVAVSAATPRVVVVVDGKGGDALPSGPFDPERDRTLQLGVRRWVEERTNVEIGYLEQLYTFGDRYRHPDERAGGARTVSIGYLALVRERDSHDARGATWSSWYQYLPWEDWRTGRPAAALGPIERHLRRWIADAPRLPLRRSRRDRVDLTFGFTGRPWNDEAVLERYELLFEAGFAPEAGRGELPVTAATVGRPMSLDYRRMLATGIGRLRGKIKYRPVIFDLLPPTFTLLQLQQTAEAIAGMPLHKGNFRRLVVAGGLVEATGGTVAATGGRPAAEFRFRREVLREREAGVRLRAARLASR